MTEQLQHLNYLLEDLPSSNSCRGVSDLNIIFSKYTKILDSINSCNENYRKTTLLYYGEINFIKDYIELSVYSETIKEKTLAFESAREKLKKDIYALSILVKPQEETVAFAF